MERLRPQGDCPLVVCMRQVLLGSWEQWALSGREPLADTLSGPAAHCLCLLSEGAITLRPLRAQNKSIRVSWPPSGSISACDPHWIFGGGCLAGDSQSAWAPHAKFLHGQDQPPLPRMGLGLGATPVLPDPNEMSATKNGTQRNLSRNKGQVLAWDEGWSTVYS